MADWGNAASEIGEPTQQDKWGAAASEVIDTAPPSNMQANIAPPEPLGPRTQNLQNIAENVVGGKISPASGMLQSASEGLGAGWDVVNQGIGMAAKGAANYLSIYHPQIMKAASKAAQQIAESPVGNVTGEQVKNIVDSYHAIKQVHPEAVGNAEAILNIGATVVPAAGIFGGAAKEIGNALSDPLRALDSMTTKSALNKAKTVRAGATDIYTQAKALEGGASPEVTQALNKSLRDLVPTDPAIKAVWDKSPAPAAVKLISQATEGQPISFEGANKIKADLNDQIKGALLAKKDQDAFLLQQVRDKLTETLSTAGSSIKDVKAQNLWKMADHEWGKQGDLQALEEITIKALTKAQPANSLDTALNNFLQNAVKSKGLRPAERAALQEVVKTTQTGELLKSGAGRIMGAAGAAIGGAPGFLVGHYGSMMARNTTEAIKLAKLDKVYELINSRPPPKMIGPWEAGAPSAPPISDFYNPVTPGVGLPREVLPPAPPPSDFHNPMTPGIGLPREVLPPAPPPSDFHNPMTPGIGLPREVLPPAPPPSDFYNPLQEKILRGKDSPLKKFTINNEKISFEDIKNIPAGVMAQIMKMPVAEGNAMLKRIIAQKGKKP